MYDLFIFDLDGTLCDPLDGISRSINHALVEHGFEAIASEQVAEFIGPPLHLAFEAILGTQDSALVDHLIRTYRKRYGEVGYAECQLYPGIADIIAELNRGPVPLAVCTSKRVDFAVRVLERFELADFFQFVDGGGVRISKGQQLKRLREQGRISQRSIMIGDRSVDLVAAHSSGLNSAGVLWGYGSREELEAEEPRHILHEPEELQNLSSLAGK